MALEISGDLVLRSGKTEIRVFNESNGHLRMVFPDWNTFGGFYKTIVKSTLSLFDIKKKLAVVNNQIIVSIQGHDRFTLTRGRIRSLGLRSFFRLLRLYIQA